jgi:hypothetical protein
MIGAVVLVAALMVVGIVGLAWYAARRRRSADA